MKLKSATSEKERKKTQVTDLKGSVRKQVVARSDYSFACFNYYQKFCSYIFFLDQQLFLFFFSPNLFQT